MANWEVKSYEFYNWSTGSQTHTIMVSTVNDVISGKLTLTLNDTSKLSITVPTKAHPFFEPVKTLLEVKHGNDRKFFGTVTKITKDLVNGTMKVEAVGVLGSFQFLPNYLGYADSTNMNGLIACESQRFRGVYSSGDPEYVASPWEEVYTPLGEGLIPSTFGYLDMSTYNSMHTTCNIDKVKRNAKNAYDFLKTITKENNYSLPTEMANPTWFKWIEDGEEAHFKPISGYNDQYISYKVNLMSCSMAVSPYKTRVHCYWNDGNGSMVTQDQTGTGYPNPFYYARKALPNKDDGSPYIVAEVQNACYNELHEQNTLVEATAFDQHLVDNSVPWLDMGKTAIIIYYDGYGEQSAQAQITQIEYDLVDSSRDRVKLGKIVSSITDSLGASSSDVAKQIEEYLPRAGGQMEGAITYDKTDFTNKRNQYSIENEIHYKKTDESSSSSERVIESSVDIVPLGWVPDFSQLTPTNNQPYVAVSRKYGTSAATATRLTSTLNGVGFSARAFNADGTSGSFTVFNPASGSLGDTKHTLYLNPREVRMDSDRYVITCNVFDSSLIEQGGLGSDGSLYLSTLYIRSGWQAVKGSTTYTMQFASNVPSVHIDYMWEFDADKNLVAFRGYSETFTTNANTKYVQFRWTKDEVAAIVPSEVHNVQLERGSSKSGYEPYTMDAVEVAEKLRTADVIAAGDLAMSPYVIDTGMKVNLTKGWWAIDALCTYQNGKPLIVSLMRLSGGYWRQIVRNDLIDVPGVQYLEASCAIKVDDDSSEIHLFTKYETASTNWCAIFAHKIV